MLVNLRFVNASLLPLILFFLNTLTAAQTDINASLDTAITRLAAEKGFSGTVLVARDEKIVFEKGYGWADKPLKIPVDTNTRFYIASISKQFTAAAILRLEEQGKLSTTDTIGKYVTEVPEDKKGITLHQLLTHTAGFKNMYAADGIKERQKAVQKLLKTPLQYNPGEKFGYTNDAYNLLAIIVEIVSGQPFETYLREQLLTPAGLTQTGFWGDSAKPGDKPIAQMIEKTRVEPNWGFRGATGIWSTAVDLYKWQQALFANRVIDKSSVEKLLSPYVDSSRGKVAYGWFISQNEKRGREFWTGGTEDFGHNAMIKVYADGTVVVVVSNSGQIGKALSRDLAIAEVEKVLVGS